MHSFVALFGLVLLSFVSSFELKDMLCTDDFCKKYIEQKGCPELSEACQAQNETHNGIFLPYPYLCNCCDYCLTNLRENEVCSRGTPGMPPPEQICGPGLACTRNKAGSPTCQPMVTDCTKAQAAWDERRLNGNLGMTEVRPKCDDDGLYAPIHCIPGSICYCVSPDGERIFGEIPFLSSSDEAKMTCGCSVNHWTALKAVDPKFVDVAFTARCNDYGLYDPLQCMTGDEANCLCVDPINGQPEDDATIISVSEIRDGYPSCFNPSAHATGSFQTECEIQKLKWHEETIATTTASSVRAKEFQKPKCQPDGKFDRVQDLETERICVDPSGEQIQNFKAPVGSAEAESMTCDCARTWWLLSKANVVELPNCCSNGNFEAWQCFRQECYCVDGNGDQQGVEVHINDIELLSCYNNNEPC